MALQADAAGWGKRTRLGHAGTGSAGWAQPGEDPQLLCPKTPLCRAATMATTSGCVSFYSPTAGPCPVNLPHLFPDLGNI